MSIKELKCPECGAPISPDRNTCDYCKAHYIVERESKVILFREYVECNTFKRLKHLKKEMEESEENEVEIAVQMLKLLRPCKVCHIKICPFFNKDLAEITK